MEALEPAQQRIRHGRDLSFFLLLLVGATMVLASFATPVERFLDESIGLTRLLFLVLGFALFYLAFLLRDLAGVRQRNLVIMETLLEATRGGLARNDPAAIDILVGALRGRTERSRAAALRELLRLTGEDLGSDPEAWEHWWQENRDLHAHPSAGAGAPFPENP